MGLMGNGEGNTLLILTDAESRLIREALDEHCVYSMRHEAVHALNRGVQRGTAKISEEYAAMQKAKKAGAK